MSVSISFQMQHQQQTNWCWAAVSTSVALYYASGSGWTQCAVADRELGRADCCNAGAPCNVYGYLDRALRVVGHFARWQSGAVSFSTITTEIQAKRPLGLRVAWDGDGAHFIAAVGATTVPGLGDVVMVADSLYGNGSFFYGKKYRGSGTWTDTYFTTARATAEVS